MKEREFIHSMTDEINPTKRTERKSRLFSIVSDIFVFRLFLIPSTRSYRKERERRGRLIKGRRVFLFFFFFLVLLFLLDLFVLLWSFLSRIGVSMYKSRINFYLWIPKYIIWIQKVLVSLERQILFRCLLFPQGLGSNGRLSLNFNSSSFKYYYNPPILSW